MEARKNRKIYYVPGIISLFFIPLLLFYFTYKLVKSSNKYSIAMNWVDIERFKENPEILGKFPPERKFIKFLITGDKTQDRKKLACSQIIIKDIVSRSDTTIGVHFQFGANAQYWSFIKAIDICRTENIKCYMPYENNLWVLHFYRPRRDTISQIELMTL